MANCDSRGSTRAEDWYRFRVAWRGLGAHLKNLGPWLKGLGRHFLLIGHTGKNIIVEEARRRGLELRTKKCR